MTHRVLATAVVLALSASSSAAGAAELAQVEKSTGKSLHAVVNFGRVDPVACPDGSTSFEAHYATVVARHSELRESDVQQEFREIELRYETVNGCEFTTTVAWGSLLDGGVGVHEQSGIKAAHIQATMPLRDSITGQIIGEAAVDVTLTGSGEPTRTTERNVIDDGGVRRVQRIVVWDADADAAGFFRIDEGVDLLTTDDIVQASMRSVTSSVRIKTTQ